MVEVDAVQLPHNPAVVSLQSERALGLAVAVVGHADTARRTGLLAFVEADCYGVDSCQDARTDPQQAGAHMEPPACRQGRRRLDHRYVLHTRKLRVRQISR